MSTYEWRPTVNEKTWPVNVGDPTRQMLLAMQVNIKTTMGYDVTLRSLAESAIRELHKRVMGAPAVG